MTKSKKRKTKERCVTFNILATDSKDEDWSEEIMIDVTFTGKIQAARLCRAAAYAIELAVRKNHVKGLDAPIIIDGKLVDTTIST